MVPSNPALKEEEANALWRNDITGSKVDLLLNVSNTEFASLLTGLEPASPSVRPLHILLDLSLPPCP